MTSLEALRARRTAELRQRRDAGERLSPTEREALALGERMEREEIERSAPHRRREEIDRAVSALLPQRTREQQIEAQRVRDAAHDAQRQREMARARADLVDDAEVGKILGNLGKAHYRQHDAALNGGHLGIHARENLRIQQIHVAHAMAARTGFSSDAVAEAPEVRHPVLAYHGEAGHLRLTAGDRSDSGWLFDLRGVSYGLGPVVPSEVSRSDDGTVRFTPRREVVEAAARRALEDPLGPVEPPGSIAFVGRADGGTDMVVREPTPAAEPGKAGLRHRIAARLAPSR